MTHLFWLSNEAWAAIDPHLPRGKPGKPRVDDRRIISGILHVLKTGCRWRDVPPEYGPATTIYNRMVAARALAASVRADCSFWRCSSRTQPRQLACESASLGSRRKKGGVGAGGRALARRSHLENPLSGR